ncbi:MAG: DUF262 domain-containing protein [Candidatus Omnitrophica bacterium]|nr:DUF262 domain-containing protein [Candidatus Omnitrophota bacterium]
MAKLNEDIEQLKEDLEAVTAVDDETSNENVPIKYAISSYGADYPVDGLVKRLQAKDVIIPEFQREYVWTLRQASRFIESLLLGLPVPGVFLSKEQETGKLLVIDGQQRLKTLQFFFEGVFRGKEFRLTEVQDEYKGRLYKELEDIDKRQLQNSVIHATVLKQDTPKDDQSSVYHVFERLNTGGSILYPQEIRACIYHGPFNNVLSEINNNTHWRNIFGKINKRLKDEELLLRFFALYYDKATYTTPFKSFLNTFMESNRKMERYSKANLEKLFSPAMEVVYKCIGEKAFRLDKAINAAVFESVMVGLATRLEKGAINNATQVKSEYEKLIKIPDYLAACKTGTSDKGKVEKRLSLAIDAFSRIS